MATESFQCFAVAAPGLEPLVARELTALGETPRVEAGGVSWTGDIRSVMRANLWLRTASRVVVRIAQFRSTAFYDLEKRARRIPWERFLAPGVAPAFRVTATKSKLHHTGGIAERLRGAADTARAVSLAAGRVAATPPQLVVVRVHRDEFTVSADASGALLHMRGYRQAVGKAPLRETLAAALLLAAEWTGRDPLVDPFCGSGTIPIEGALIARRMAPGLERPFAFAHWPAYDADVWRALVAEARAAALPAAPCPISGSDRDAGAIASARANAARAGVESDIEFGTRSISALAVRGTGLVATNPPYGVRVGDARGLRDLYVSFGRVLRERCRGWRVAAYAQRRLLGYAGLPFQPLYSTRNGGLNVTAVLARVPTPEVGTVLEHGDA